MDKVRKTLEQIGLNEKEIKIYLTALSIWQSPASILWQRNNIVRSTAQYTCQSLADKGLFHVTPKGNTFLYSPCEPEKLLSLVNKEYDLVEKKFHATRQIMGDLKSMMNPAMNLPKVKYFTGVEGIKDLVNDVFIEKNIIYGALELTDKMHPDITRYINEEYIPKRKESKFASKMLFNNNNRTQKYQSIDTQMNRISLLVSKEDFPFESCLHIYGNKVAIYSFNEDDLTGILIENEYVKNMFLSLYKMAWKFAKNLPENEKYKNEEL